MVAHSDNSTDDDNDDDDDNDGDDDDEAPIPFSTQSILITQ